MPERAIAAGSVDLRLVHGVHKHVGAVGEVLQQVDIDVKGEQKRLVL